jgi:heme exporter protein D
MEDPRRAQWRNKLPAWMRELPFFTRVAPEPDPTHQLIKREELTTLLTAHGIAPTSKAAERLDKDIAFLEHELLRLYRNRDHNAKLQQKRYRSNQIGYTILAMAAAISGSFQALALAAAPSWMPWIAFAETVIALLAVFLATISGREAPLPSWLSDRRRAEHMRREYFHFLLNLPPYSGLDDINRRLTLSRRAADINRGVYPDEPALT